MRTGTFPVCPEGADTSQLLGNWIALLPQTNKGQAANRRREPVAPTAVGESPFCPLPPLP